MDAPSGEVISLSLSDVALLLQTDVVLPLSEVVVAVRCHCWCCLLDFVKIEIEDEDDVGEQVFVHRSCGCV